ncbi:A/G-specific adenine glycosylase [Helicobacter mesocricetorum]|uniref:A/G-specific adenine glycosylase n=1 Tax=Helicobacter mesocricetorum TaxID=87012 RepID=UPI000CF07EC3|nr:A/G-specific adenine glycosylase [Helicobacter mesocricetorum]
MNISLFQAELLRWYEKEGRRTLPWRDRSMPNRPYRVLVSEIMLQQTQVKTILEHYYFPFLQKFPTLESLAKASEEEVLLQWRGMGYYTRARHLLKCAKICLRDFQGVLPDCVELLKTLPGIGSYTAGAVACFGFDRAVCFVDSNIKRILIRLFALYNPTQSLLESKAREILNIQHPFNHNQALIDLGALICTATNPKCLLCPVSEFCKGKEDLKALNLKKTPKSIKKSLHIGIFEKDSHIALHKSQERLYYNLYNFPLLKSHQSLQKLGILKHSYTKYLLDLHIYRVKNLESLAQSVEFFNKESLQTIPISSMTLKILELLEKDF